MFRHLPIAALLVMFLCPTAGLAQNSAPAATTEASDRLVVFPPATQTLPSPLLSTSGRFSSLDPPNQIVCHNSNVTGRVISTRLIRVDQFGCDDYGAGFGYGGCCSLMNVELSQSVDIEKMVVGRLVTIKGTFKSARENHGNYPVFFLIAKNARVLYGDPFDRPAAPAQADPVFMMCQPPELDALASQLGHELCVQSTLVTNLSMTGSALERAARAPAQGPPKDESSSDPNAITCHQDAERTDIRLQEAVACARNSYWAWWAAKQRSPIADSQPAPP